VKVEWELGVVLIAVAIAALALIWWIGGLVFRRCMYNWAYFARGAWWRKVGRGVGKRFYVVTLLQPLAMVVVIACFTELLWEGKTLEGFVLALGAIGFVFIYGPQFTLPSIQAAFVTGRDEMFADDSLAKRVQVSAGDQCLLRFRITNLGISYLENCTVRFCFDRGFEVLTDESAYADVDIRKALTVRKQNGCQCAVFEPPANYMGVPSGNHLYFAVRVKTPAEEGSYSVRAVVAGQPRWGEVEVKLTLSIGDEAT
jgi:hypothetical protein